MQMPTKCRYYVREQHVCGEIHQPLSEILRAIPIPQVILLLLILER